MSDRNVSGSLGVETHLRIGIEGSSTILYPDNRGGLLVAQGAATAVPYLVGGSAQTVSLSSGLWFNINGTGNAGTVAANARAVMSRFQVGKVCTLNGLSVDITIAGEAGSVIRFGLYTDADGVPGTRIQDFGTVDGTVTGATALVVSQSVTPGWYWVCTAHQLCPTTRPTIRVSNVALTGYQTAGAATPGGTTVGSGYFFDTGMSGALPATAGTPTGVITASNTPSLWLKAA